MILPRSTTALAVTVALAMATSPLHSQSPRRGAASDTSPAALIARADALQDDSSKASLELVNRAIPRLTLPRDLVLHARALRIRCWAASDEAPDSTMSWANQAVAAAERAGDERILAEARVCRGYAREDAEDIAGAMADYELGVAEGKRLRAPELLADALVLRGELRYYRGEFNHAIRDLTDAYELFQKQQRRSQVLYTMNALANLYADARMGQYERALEYYRRILAEYQRVGDQREVAVQHYNLGGTLEALQRYPEALAEYRRGLALDIAARDAGEVAVDRRAIGIVLSKMGRPAEGLRELERAVAYWEREGQKESLAAGRLSRAVTLRMLGRTREAIADVEYALAHFRNTGNRRYLERIHNERALVYAAAGDWKTAYEARSAHQAIQAEAEKEAREEQSARLRVEFESERRDEEARALARESALRGQALESAARVRRLQLAVIVLATLIILALGLLVARQVRAGRRLRMLAMVDELTQVNNRRAVLEQAESLARAARAGGPGFAMLALDVDHFKPINDAFGHEAGDRVLQRVAAACRSAIRPGDHVGRLGGEEFLVLLPGATPRGAIEVGERLRAAVAAADLGDVAPGMAVTVSVGPAVWTPDDKTAATVLKRADDELYRAKRMGRNRVGSGQMSLVTPPTGIASQR